jgi:ribosome-binding protein aMBF1 (putative translation factor)
VIANEVQRRVTQTAIHEFEEALAHVDERNAELDPRLRRAMREAIESQLADLREELAAYEALRAGEVRVLELDSLDQLPEALIRARIAAGLSQKELAGRLGLKEQQIQRYEARRYAGASLARVQAVADALGVQIHERVVLPTATSPAGAAGAPTATSPVKRRSVPAASAEG